LIINAAFEDWGLEKRKLGSHTTPMITLPPKMPPKKSAKGTGPLSVIRAINNPDAPCSVFYHVDELTTNLGAASTDESVRAISDKESLDVTIEQKRNTGRHHR
jgi:hypothetical protein